MAVELGPVVISLLAAVEPKDPTKLVLTRKSDNAVLLYSVARLGNGGRMILQIQPPNWFGRIPAVHRYRDQVSTVLEVANDYLTWHLTASARRVER